MSVEAGLGGRGDERERWSCKNPADVRRSKCELEITNTALVPLEVDD